jgi:DNA polymerase-3 subunit gamma/tau
MPPSAVPTPVAPIAHDASVETKSADDASTATSSDCEPVVPTPPRDVPPATAPRAFSPQPSNDGGLRDAGAWRDWVAACDLRGPARILAENVGFVGCRDGVLALSIEPSDEHLKGAAMVRMLADALAPRFGSSPHIRFEAPAQPVDSVRVHMDRARDARQSAADRDFEQHPDVRRLVAQGGRIVPESVRPLEG